MDQSTKEFSLDRLQPYQPRTFVPETVDFAKPEHVTALYEQLAARRVGSARELEQWLLDRSELEAALDQYSAVLYIKMTCQTDHAPFAEAYKFFIETVPPAVKPFSHQLNQKYMRLKEEFPLDSRRYEVLNRETACDLELFREENIPLETQLNLLSQEYQTVCGAMTVHFDGEEKTMPQMGRYLQKTDRAIRESAWRAIARRRLQDREKLDALFDRMLELRNTLARRAGFADFRDYQFKAYHRFDYTPVDCEAYHAAVQASVVPLWAKILERRKQRMGLEALRPWDLQVDPEGRPALKPFEAVDGLVYGVQKIFSCIDSELGGRFASMADEQLLDLASRKGKAPGGYQHSLAESRKPFIFMNAVGLDDDVRTLLHEGGHAFHALACAHDPLLDYRHAPMEFCEVASMSMELLGDGYLTEFYSEEDARRSRIAHLESVVYILVWVAVVDAFQHWLYLNPGHTPDERRRAWLDINQRFSSDRVDWTGLEEERAFSWHRQLHIFEVPFYYIEYGIAQLGALQIWQQALKDQPKAIARYKAALSLGGSRPLPELFEAAGLKLDFSVKTITPLTARLAQELDIPNTDV